MNRAFPLGAAALAATCAAACGGATVAKDATSAQPVEDHDHRAHGGHGHHHRFDDAEAWAKQFDDPARDEWQRPAEVVELLELSAGMTVADLGAGTGYFVPWLSRAVGPSGRVLALDVEPDMVRYMEDRFVREALANTEARLVPHDDPELAAASLDRILIVDTWHHIESRGAYAAKLKAALRPGGRVVVVDFTADARRGPPPAMRLSAEVVIRELAEAGLKGRVLTETLPDQYVVEAGL